MLSLVCAHFLGQPGGWLRGIHLKASARPPQAQAAGGVSRAIPRGPIGFPAQNRRAERSIPLRRVTRRLGSVWRPLTVTDVKSRLTGRESEFASPASARTGDFGIESPVWSS